MGKIEDQVKKLQAVTTQSGMLPPDPLQQGQAGMLQNVSPEDAAMLERLAQNNPEPGMPSMPSFSMMDLPVEALSIGEIYYALKFAQEQQMADVEITLQNFMEKQVRAIAAKVADEVDIVPAERPEPGDVIKISN